MRVAASTLIDQAIDLTSGLPQLLATPIKRRGKFVCWQLQLDFRKRIKPLPYKKKRSSTKKKKDENPSAKKVAKGIADRDEFLKQVGIQEKYDNMLHMSRKYIIKALNKTRTMKGLSKAAEAELASDFLHDTIAKVATLLEQGNFKGKSEDHAGNLCGYCYTFITLDAKRYIRKMDEAKMQLRLDTKDIGVGSLGGLLSDVPEYMEGHKDEFADFAHEYIFEWIRLRKWKTTDDQVASQIFRMYYGTTDDVKTIARKTGYHKAVVIKMHKTMLEYIKEHVSTRTIIEAFGRKIMEGCKC